MKDICVVYQKNNKSVTKKLASKLESDGISCHVAFRDFKLEEKDAVQKAVEDSKFLLMIMDKSSAKSEELMTALEIALENEMDIVPFVIEKIDTDLYSEHFFYQYSWVDAFEDSFDDAYEVLIDAYEELSGENAGKNKGKVSKKHKQGDTSNKTAIYVVGAILVIILGYFVYDNFMGNNDSVLVGEWNITDYRDNLRRTGQDSVLFYTQTVPSLKRNALLIFNDDNTFERRGFSPEPQIGTWELSNDEKTLRLTPHGSTSNADKLNIDQLTENSFTILVTETMQDSSKVNTRLTFSRKVVEVQ